MCVCVFFIFLIFLAGWEVVATMDQKGINTRETFTKNSVEQFCHVVQLFTILLSLGWMISDFLQFFGSLD